MLHSQVVASSGNFRGKALRAVREQALQNPTASEEMPGLQVTQDALQIL